MVTLAMVTYLDRACIGAMAPSISREFDLDSGEMSWVFLAFSLAYALFEIPTARWADRRGARNVLTRIVSWWSVFTLATAGAWNYGSLLVMRFLFGAGEAGAFPCMARVMSRWIPLRERGTAKGIFFAGAYISAAATTYAVTQLLAHFDWRTILVAFGLVGFVWAAAWHRWFRNDPTEHASANEAERAFILADRPPESPHPRGLAFWLNLLRDRNVRLLCLMYMPNCAAFYFCITWLPTYFENQHGLEKTTLGIFASLPLILAVIAQFFGGYISDRMRRRFGITAARRVPGFVGYALAAVFIFIASATTQPVPAAIWIALSVATCMLTTAPAWSTCVDIDHENSATVAATMNTAGQIAAVFSAPIVGYSVKWMGNWNVPFWLLGGLFVMGAICWLFIDPARPIYHHAKPVIPGSHS
jgi:MFS transporter, ACS family, glucarate transporter